MLSNPPRLRSLRRARRLERITVIRKSVGTFFGASHREAKDRCSWRNVGVDGDDGDDEIMKPMACYYILKRDDFDHLHDAGGWAATCLMTFASKVIDRWNMMRVFSLSTWCSPLHSTPRNCRRGTDSSENNKPSTDGIHGP